MLWRLIQADAAANGRRLLQTFAAIRVSEGSGIAVLRADALKYFGVAIKRVGQQFDRGEKPSNVRILFFQQPPSFIRLDQEAAGIAEDRAVQESYGMSRSKGLLQRGQHGMLRGYVVAPRHIDPKAVAYQLVVLRLVIHLKRGVIRRHARRLDKRGKDSSFFLPPVHADKFVV